MNQAQEYWRRAAAILNDARAAITTPDLAEAERLLTLADEADETDRQLRRAEALELQRLLEPELWAGCQCSRGPLG